MVNLGVRLLVSGAEAGAPATGGIFFIDRGHVGTVEVNPFQ